jgi:putative SOS response-associated peptidase YedK
MCGRFAQRNPTKLVEERLGVAVPERRPRFNVAPTQDVLAVREGKSGREAAWLRWGLVPAWSRDLSLGARLINARSETVAEKPSFREAFRQRRCLIAADGFYEWKRMGTGKQPYFFEMKDGSPFAFAGLWELWEGEGDVVETCSILTTANEILAPVHDRMPVILAVENYELWLDAGTGNSKQLQELLCPFPACEMVAYPVSQYVNDPTHDDERCVQALSTVSTIENAEMSAYQSPVLQSRG